MTGVLQRTRALPTYSGVAVLWLVLVIWASVTLPGFMTQANITNITVSSAVPFVLAIGVTVTVLLGGIDLSVGSMLALAGVLLASFSEQFGGGLSILLTVACAAIIGGGTNAVLIGRFNLNPFVVTLGGLSFFRGVAYLVSDGETKTVSSPVVQEFGFGSFLGVPVPVLVMVVVLATSWFVLRSTYFGRHVYAIGGNRDAARISGVPTRRVIAAVYVVSGLCVGIAAVLQTGRSGAAAPTAAAGIELLVAASVLLGGTRLSGGAGSVIGTTVAVLFLATLDNVLTLRGVTSYWQLVVVGGLLIAAVAIDRARSGGRD